MAFGVRDFRGAGWKTLTAGFCAGLIVLTSATGADARRKKKRVHYSPPYASIVIDANSGRVLQASNPDAPRFPASITKVMTLYMLFEQLEAGRMNLRTPIQFSHHASSQSPSKLGIRPGRSISTEQAILALVTKSANDVAAAVAEAIGGSEPAFAAMMTAKARSLGMRNTSFGNASGLPNPRNVTTARDLARLGRAIHSHFPRYYSYFATPSFRFGRANMRNHNRLLGRVRGVDGIKTGYTRASGFNLLTSAHLGNRRIVAVVLGGRSGRIRDNIMADLVVANIQRGASHVTVAAIPKPSATRRTQIAAEAPKPQPRPVEVEAVPAAPARRIASMPKPAPQILPAGKPVALSAYARIASTAATGQPAVVSGTIAPADLIPTASIPDRPAVIDGSTRVRAVQARTDAARSFTRTATPSELRWIRGREGVSRSLVPARNIGQATAPAPRAKLAARATPVEAPAPKKQRRAAAVTEVPPTPPAAIPARARPKAALSGVMIQIGAAENPEKAQALLSKAKSKSPGALAGAKPFTEPVRVKGSTLYRARFAGLDEQAAQRACKTLKRSGFGCFTTRN
ncbi:MAG: serine hydrolase [Beijerinckiaceae bacterium]